MIVVGCLALAKLFIHFLFNGRYGTFIDEFYYIACTDHLSWGYVDHPPLSILVLKTTRWLLGDSMFAIRLPAVLAGAATVFMTGLLARRLGGGRFAQALAALAVLVAPVFLGVGTFFSMNPMDQLFWVVAAYLLIHIIQTNDARGWLWFGVVVGLGLLNKYSMGFLAFGVGVGLLLTPHRKWLRSRWLWLGVAVALLIVLPYIIWEVALGLPSLEFMRHSVLYKFAPTSPLAFLAGQLLLLGPLNAPVWLVGLAYLLFSRAARTYRILAFIYLVVLAIFVIQQAKGYYLAPAYPMLFAAGGLAIEQFAQRRAWPWLQTATVVPVVAGGLVLMPYALPVLPVETYLQYQTFLGIRVPQAERGHTSVLPQHFADCFGWRELVAAVAGVYKGLSQADQARCAVFAGDYGKAAAIDFFGPAHGLPKAISGHNSYWLWGPRGATGEVVIAVGVSRRELQEVFESVEEVAESETKYGLASRARIFLCRRAKKPLDQLWAGTREYG